MIEFEKTVLRHGDKTIATFENGFEPTCNKGDFVLIRYCEYEVEKVIYDFENTELVLILV